MLADTFPCYLLTFHYHIQTFLLCIAVRSVGSYCSSDWTFVRHSYKWYYRIGL